MKKILGLTIAAVLVMALVGGGTWAYFSDVETTTANILSAGTLDLTLGASGVIHGSVSDVVPGDGEPTPVSASVSLTSAGTIGGELDIDFDDSVVNLENFDSDTDEAEDDNDGDTSTDAELGGRCLIALYIDVNGTGWDNAVDIGLQSTTNTTYNYAADLSGNAESGDTTVLTDSSHGHGDVTGRMLVVGSEQRLITSNDTDTITVTDAFSTPIGTSAYTIPRMQWDAIDDYEGVTWDNVYGAAMTTSPDDFYVLYRVPTAVNNEIMGDSVDFTIEFTLEQTTAD